MPQNEDINTFCKFKCDNKTKSFGCRRCHTSMEIGRHTRRCFMTGEYCSQQMNIQKERDRLHDSNRIFAFVVMNFSDMSDVIYNWKIRTFVESLKKYLYFDKTNRQLYCSAAENDIEKNADGNYFLGNNQLYPVEGIEVIRADTDPSSNYVICSRICQQMQIADLIIVDVSNQNPNVFYEFGMAAALGKLILPICYSESFYKRNISKKLKKVLLEEENKELEHHMDFYPWRRKLYEYYGIYFKQDISQTRYLDFELAVAEKYGFSDVGYSRFPYHVKFSDSPSCTVGKKIYEILADNYNNLSPNHNTLIVYTMEGFLNEGEAGKCIVNYYCAITSRIKEEHCFCGERVAILAQSNSVTENDKDTAEHVNIAYNIGEIIRMGINEATYRSSVDQIQAEDIWKMPADTEAASVDKPTSEKPTQEQIDALTVYIKDYIRNRGIIVYANNPIYVERLESFLHNKLLELNNTTSNCWASQFFCFFHVILKTLCYANEVVVDITNTDNCLQSLFWLGVAHGTGTYAITVKCEIPISENQTEEQPDPTHTRNIFDISGLWTAIYYTHNTESFYKQLEMAQRGIERHAKLMLPDSQIYNKEINEYIKNLKLSAAKNDPETNKIITGILHRKFNEEKSILESFYRKKFWSKMLYYNHLRLYISEYDDKDKNDNDPRIRVAKWDFDAVSLLTHYLSKRSAIGEYKVLSLHENERDPKVQKTNYLCVGRPVKPSGEELVKHIYGQMKNATMIIHHPLIYSSNSSSECTKAYPRMYKGFQKYSADSPDTQPALLTQHPCAHCSNCSYPAPHSEETTDCNNKIYSSINLAEASSCVLHNSPDHIEVAQLILWREEHTSSSDTHFQVSITGSSGPATVALATLFVEEKGESNNIIATLTENKIKKTELLCELQLRVRKKILSLYNEQLDKRLEKIFWQIEENNKKIEKDYLDPQIQRYCNLIKQSTTMYLSTVLYKYFFPFLSEQDICRIKNGMWTFISSMNSARISPFALSFPANGDPTFEGSISNTTIKGIAPKIPEIIECVLKGFKGMEVFYQVSVLHNNEDIQSTNTDGDKEYSKDTRRIDSIELLNYKENIFYFINKELLS